MIKKIFISLLAVFWLWISYSFAIVTWEVVNNWSSINSMYDRNYNIMVNNRWLLYTTYQWMNWKQVLMFYKWNYFTWTFQWLPYISINLYSDDNQFQWVVSNFLLCDELNQWDLPTNCAGYDYLTQSWYALNIIKNSNKRFYWTYYQDRWWADATKWPIFCFSSSEFELSACFYWCFHANCWSYWDHIWWFSPYRNLWENLWLGLDLANIDQSKLWSYPWAFVWWDTVWSTDVNYNTSISWDYTYWTCTYKEIIDYAEYYWYNEYLCYAWSSDRNNYDPTQTYQFIPWTWVDLPTLYNYTKDWKSLFDWFKYWRWMYNWSTWNVDNALWQQQPVVLRLRFYAFATYWWDTLWWIEAVHEYCLMKKMVTGDALNWKYTWTKFKNTCWAIVEQKANWTYLNDSSYSWSLSWSSVDVPVSVNWLWVWNLSWWNVSDPLSFLQNFFNQLKTSLNTNSFWNTWEWFIPWYIIIALLWLIIFRFLSH